MVIDTFYLEALPIFVYGTYTCLQSSSPYCSGRQGVNIMLSTRYTHYLSVWHLYIMAGEVWASRQRYLADRHNQMCSPLLTMSDTLSERVCFIFIMYSNNKKNYVTWMHKRVFTKVKNLEQK
jgi:hypothetical protein